MTARANAIVNQLYVVNVNAAAPAGLGRSLIVDPEGMVKVQAGDADELLTDVLDLDASLGCASSAPRASRGCGGRSTAAPPPRSSCRCTRAGGPAPAAAIGRGLPARLRKNNSGRDPIHRRPQRAKGMASHRALADLPCANDFDTYRCSGNSSWPTQRDQTSLECCGRALVWRRAHRDRTPAPRLDRSSARI